MLQRDEDYNRDRGSLIAGNNGKCADRSDGYEMYDLNGKKTSEFTAGKDRFDEPTWLGATR